MAQLCGGSFHVPTVPVLCDLHLALLIVSISPALQLLQGAAMMGFVQDTRVGGGNRMARSSQYQRLECWDDDGAAPSPRSWWRWLPALNGKQASPCLFSVKRLKWSKITSVLIPRKVVAEFAAKIRHAGAKTEADVCPTVVFMSPWGLPVLSRPLLVDHKSRYQSLEGSKGHF